MEGLIIGSYSLQAHFGAQRLADSHDRPQSSGLGRLLAAIVLIALIFAGLQAGAVGGPERATATVADTGR